MEITSIKKIFLIIMLAIAGCATLCFAQEPAQVRIPTSAVAQSDISQIRRWLKENHHAEMIYKQEAEAEAKDPNALVVENQPLTYEQSQKLMLSAAPVTSPTDPENEGVFNALLKQSVPLNPQQVVRLRQMIDASQRAANIPATIPPKPISSTMLINLAPGATPPAIRLYQGYVSSLVFVDSAGNPWPVESYDLGNPKTTSVQWDGKSNVLLMQAQAAYGDSDLVIRMVGLNTPITLQLVLGQRVIDYRLDIRVPGLGPNSQDLPLGSGLPNSANQYLLGVLDGVGPPGSKQLTVKGGDCQAWLTEDRMFLRTRYTVLSPGWVGRMNSPDGMYAYEMQTSSSVLVSEYGNPIELKIEGF
jgi:intracellular multiplication protein IcmK